MNIWDWKQYSDIDVDCYFGCGSCFSQLPDIDIFRIGEQCTAAIKAACSTTDAIGDEEGNGIKFWRDLRQKIKWQKDENTKRQWPKGEFDILMSGQFCTIALFCLRIRENVE